MIIQVLKSKIHRVTVTEADVNYIGSITIDPILLEAANMIEGERVQVLNCANGERLETYIILGERGSGGGVVTRCVDVSCVTASVLIGQTADRISVQWGVVESTPSITALTHHIVTHRPPYHKRLYHTNDLLHGIHSDV